MIASNASTIFVLFSFGCYYITARETHGQKAIDTVDESTGGVISMPAKAVEPTPKAAIGKVAILRYCGCLALPPSRTLGGHL